MALSDDLARRLDQAIAARWEEQVAFLAALVKTPSDNPPGDCAPLAALAASHLERLGFTVETHAVPADIVAAHDMVSVTNLVVRRSFGEGVTVALNAHGDVVPPGTGWTHGPYSAAIVDGAMYGRGAAVSKSDFATYAFALLALETVAESLSGTVELHFTFDEEAGGLVGPQWLLDQGIVRPDYCISAGLSYAVVTAHNGCLHLAVEVRGKSAHAAAPETGDDALEATVAILGALYDERRSYPEQISPLPGIGHPNLTVGLIEGGINTNVVPDRVRFRLDRRMTPEENPDAVEGHLRGVIERAMAQRPGITVVVERILLASPLRVLPGTETLAGMLQKHASDILGMQIETKGVPLFTDARLYADAGIPTVSYGAGPRSFLEANGHRADEHVRLNDLRLATRVVARSLADILARQA